MAITIYTQRTPRIRTTTLDHVKNGRKGRDARIDILLGRIIRRTTPDINAMHGLIDAYIIYAEMVWECEMCEIDCAKVFGHSEVDDYVLEISTPIC